MNSRKRKVQWAILRFRFRVKPIQPIYQLVAVSRTRFEGSIQLLLEYSVVNTNTPIVNSADSDIGTASTVPLTPAQAIMYWQSRPKPPNSSGLPANITDDATFAQAVDYFHEQTGEGRKFFRAEAQAAFPPLQVLPIFTVGEAPLYDPYDF